MRAAWNKWKARLPVLPRKWRLVRNVLLAALALGALPVLLDWPVWSAEAAFRKLEREALLSPSEIVLRVGDAFLTEGEDWIAVGQVENYDTNWKPFQKKMAYINHVLPKGGLIVAAIPEVEDDALTVAVTGLPEDAAGGTLTLTVSGVDLHPVDGWRTMGEESFTASAVREGEWMFFRLAVHDHGEGAQCIMERLWWELTMGQAVAQYPYTLELRNAHGAAVGIDSGTLPADLRFLDSRR